MGHFEVVKEWVEDDDDDLDDYCHQCGEDLDDCECAIGSDCTCGAYQITDKGIFQIADCCCGRA